MRRRAQKSKKQRWEKIDKSLNVRDQDEYKTIEGKGTTFNQTTIVYITCFFYLFTSFPWIACWLELEISRFDSSISIFWSKINVVLKIPYNFYSTTFIVLRFQSLSHSYGSQNSKKMKWMKLTYLAKEHWTLPSRNKNLLSNLST